MNMVNDWINCVAFVTALALTFVVAYWLSLVTFSSVRTTATTVGSFSFAIPKILFFPLAIYAFVTPVLVASVIMSTRGSKPRMAPALAVGLLVLYVVVCFDAHSRIDVFRRVRTIWDYLPGITTGILTGATAIVLARMCLFGKGSQVL